MWVKKKRGSRLAKMGYMLATVSCLASRTYMAPRALEKNKKNALFAICYFEVS